MGIKDQFTTVFEKIGTEFRRISDGAVDYLDVELPKGVTWRGRFIRECSMRQDTLFSDGDVIQNTIDDKVYLISRSETELLLNEGIFKQGELYFCNCSGQVAVPTRTRSTNMETSVTFTTIVRDKYFCMVPQRLDVNEFGVVPSSVEEFFVYAPVSYNIEQGYRIQTISPFVQNYKVKSVDKYSKNNIVIANVEKDSR